MVGIELMIKENDQMDDRISRAYYGDHFIQLKTSGAKIVQIE